MKKKLICLIMAFSTILYMTGCSYNDNWDISDFVSDDSQMPETEKMWQIGVLAAKTGEYSEAGLSMVDGLKLAVDEINEAGGIEGRQVTYLVMDDEDNGKKAENTYNTLKDWGMDFLIGTTNEDTTVNIAALTDEDKIFMLSPAVVEDDELKQYQSLYSVYLSEQTMGTEVADFIANNELGTNVAVFYERFNVDMREMASSFTDEMSKNNLNLVATEKFMLSHTLNFEDMLLECQEAGADVVFIPLDQTECKMILQKAAELEYDPVFVGLENLGELMESEEGSDISVSRVIALSEANTEENSTDVIQFTRKFSLAYGTTPDENARAGYDSVYILKEAIEKAEPKDDPTQEEMFDIICQAMQKISYSGLIGEDTTWNSDGLASKELFSRTYINAVN